MITRDEFMAYANHPEIGYLFDNPQSPFGDWGIECGPGWYDIVLVGCRWISLNDPEQIVRIAQIKSKFGGMRFYLDYICDDDETRKNVFNRVHNIPTIIEHQASMICSSCGSIKKLNHQTLKYENCDCNKGN